MTAAYDPATGTLTLQLDGDARGTLELLGHALMAASQDEGGGLLPEMVEVADVADAVLHVSGARG